MRKKRFRKLAAVLCGAVLLLAGCGGTEGSSTDSGSGSGSGGDAPVDTSDFLVPSHPGDVVLGNSLAKIDASNTSEGYVSIKYKGDSEKVKLQIKCGSETYTYDMDRKAGYMVFPFSCGDGTYSLEVYENITGDQYAQVCAETLEVELEDPNRPYLYPNNYVDYDRDDQVVDLTFEVTKDSETQLQVVSDVYGYVTGNIDYDYDLAANVGTGYIPDLDTTIETKKGICFDYSSLMSAMLRIRNIPTKLVVGYSGDEYHAWISVYIDDVGWVENVIEFDGNEWTLMDPTYAASGGAEAEAYYVNNQDQYHALYFY